MKKKNLANKLVDLGILKQYDMVNISYIDSIQTKITGGGKISNNENNICPTLTTRPDCLGVVVKDERKILSIGSYEEIHK